jgi:Tat protein translocase TatB subunit
MFEVGFTEIILIFGIALLVLGPARLPKLAADLGRWAGRARSMARQLRTQLEQETQFDPLADPKPAAQAASNTIHTPPAGAPAPASDSATDPETEAVARAVPAQLATDAPAPVSTAVSLDEAASLNPTPDAVAPPAKTDADEPKSG